MILQISDNAEEFRIEIKGPFIDSTVMKASMSWRAALLANKPRRISVDITHLTGYDHAGYKLLRDMHSHGTHIVAGTPKSLQFLSQISGPMIPSHQLAGMSGAAAKKVVSIRQVQRAAASGE